MTAPQFDVVIVNWNAGDQLRDCVASIYRNHEGLVDQVIIVDNGSIDGSAEQAKLGDRTHLIMAGRNLGFARGCNLGAAAGAAPFIVFLNPDTRIFSGTFGAVHRFMTAPEGSNYGIVGVKTLDEEGTVHRHCAYFPTATFYLAHALGLHRLFPTLAREHFMAGFDHLESRPVEQTIGAFNAIRRNLFDQLGGYDERFFVYMEDVDLALRAAQMGFPSFYLAEAEIFHRGHGTTSQIKATRLFYNLRSRILYGFKHFPLMSGVAVLASTLVLEFASRAGGALVRRSGEDLRNTTLAYRKLWGELGDILRTSRGRVR